jgi:hypothetical protein
LLYIYLYTVADIKKKKLGWIRHVARFDQGRLRKCLRVNQKEVKEREDQD